MPTTSLFLLGFFFENRHCVIRHCEEARGSNLSISVKIASFLAMT